MSHPTTSGRRPPAARCCRLRVTPPLVSKGVVFYPWAYVCKGRLALAERATHVGAVHPPRPARRVWGLETERAPSCTNS